MNIDNESFYYFSTEGFSPELPVKATFIKKLKNAKDREAILVRCDREIISYKTAYLVLVPKHQGDSFISIENSEQVFTYVINGSSYLKKDLIDLSQGARMIIDWGGVTFSFDIANKWQVKKTDM